MLLKKCRRLKNGCRFDYKKLKKPYWNVKFIIVWLCEGNSKMAVDLVTKEVDWNVKLTKIAFYENIICM